MSELFTREEIAKRNRKEDIAIIIDNVVYGVSAFLEDHPGGLEVLLANAGKDASQCFHDVGHSDEAKLLRTKFKIGEVVEEDRWEVIKPRTLPPPTLQESSYGYFDVWGQPLMLGIVATFIYWYLFL